MVDMNNTENNGEPKSTVLGETLEQKLDKVFDICLRSKVKYGYRDWPSEVVDLQHEEIDSERQQLKARISKLMLDARIEEHNIVSDSFSGSDMNAISSGSRSRLKQRLAALNKQRESM